MFLRHLPLPPPFCASLRISCIYSFVFISLGKVSTLLEVSIWRRMRVNCPLVLVIVHSFTFILSAIVVAKEAEGVCVCVCVRGSCAASSTELSKKMPPASPVLLSQRESVPTSLPSCSLFSSCLWVLMWESVLRERGRAWELFFAIHAKDTKNTRCCCGVDVAACPLPRPVFVFVFAFLSYVLKA